MILRNLFAKSFRQNTKCRNHQIIRQIHINKEVILGSKNQENGGDHSSIIIAHGMLGSLANWSSLSRRIAKETGRTVITFDARNHGQSEHTETMTYQEMAADMKSLIDKYLRRERCWCVKLTTC
jgi:pimeloyl-ACP methyl ester carboxylesterase